ncbi:MAG: WD40 repeat domain-containing protein [Acidobacteria bacterium]|nr:WD40 repeat domain-containing protein [Acidobacteriota bacterium]
MSELEPETIFMPRTFHREGESTVIHLENDRCALLKDRMEILAALPGLNTISPGASTMDADGTIWGEVPSGEASRPGESLHAARNTFFAELRQQLEAGAITCAGVFCYGWIGDNDSRFTETLADANMLTAWLVHKTQIVEVSIPYNRHPAEGESAHGSPTGEIIETLPFVSGQHVRWVFQPPSSSPPGVAACAVGDQVLAVHRGGVVERWDLVAGAPIDAVVLSQGLSACAVSGDCAWYLTGFSDGRTALWQADRREKTMGPSEPDAVTACALDESGNHALVSFANGALAFWDPLTGKIYWSAEAAGVCALSADGTRALTSMRGGPPVLWNIPESEEPEIQYALRAEQAEITAAALSARGHAALTSSTDGKTFVGALDLKRSRHALNGPGPVHACAITRDGQFALAAHNGVTVLWDAFAGYPLQKIQVDGHHSAVAFTADGMSALLGSSDGTLTCIQLFPS